MKGRTTLFLLASVGILGSFIWFVERKNDTTDERYEQGRNVLKVIAHRINYLRFETSDLVIECEKDENQWFLRRPVNARADAGMIDRIFTQLGGLSRNAVITSDDLKKHGSTLADYGFVRPRAQLTWGDGARRDTLWVGHDAPVGNSIYIKFEHEPDILVTSSDLMAFFPKDPQRFRDRILFDREVAQVKRIDIQRKEGFLRIARTDHHAWEIQQPLEGRADLSTVLQLVDDILDLRIEHFIADGVVDTAAYGFDDVNMQVSLLMEGVDQVQTLYLGKKYEKDESLVYAKRNREDSVVAISDKIFSKLNMKANELRDSRLLAFPSYQIDTIMIEQKNEVLEFRRVEKETWKIVHPAEWEADNERVESMLMAWMETRVQTFYDHSVTNLHARGFVKPLCVIKFSRNHAINDMQEMVVIQISSEEPDDGLVTVKVDPGKAYYKISDSVLEKTRLNPLYFRNRQVLSLSSHDIRKVTLSINGKEQVVEKNGQGNYQPSFVDGGELSEKVLKEVIRTVTDLWAEEYIEESPKDLSIFRLDPPQAVLRLGLSGEAGIGKAILLGKTSPSKGRYAMIRGQDVVFTLDDKSAATIIQSMYEPKASSDEASQDEP
ncbi:MAG: DUF4340 domain-containing protein [Kiritimatiellae bacterium]|nr:DUF4340 domain-containing protein [Kiritimatiellia bacterium]